MVRPLLIASFEGVVLNAPFVAGSGLLVNASQGYDLAIAIRTFSSSQPLFSLIVHWSNSNRLWRLAGRLGVSEMSLFAFLLFSSGFATSLVFVGLFGWISLAAITLEQFAMFMILLMSYCFYVSQARFIAMELPGKLATFTYVIFIFGFLIMLALTPDEVTSAWSVIAMQGATLSLAAWLIIALNHHHKHS